MLIAVVVLVVVALIVAVVVMLVIVVVVVVGREGEVVVYVFVTCTGVSVARRVYMRIYGY